jgi:hypothetical protein
MEIRKAELSQVCQNFDHAGWERKPRILITAQNYDGEKCEVGNELEFSEWCEQVETWVSEVSTHFLRHWDSVTVRKLAGKRAA